MNDHAQQLYIAEAEGDDVNEAELSLDQQSEKIRDAWRDLVKNQMGSASNYDSWCAEIYEDAVVVKSGDDYWRVPYTIGTDGAIFDRDAAKKVERTWVDVTEAEGWFAEPVVEAESDAEDPSGSEWDVTIVTVGASKNGRIYSKKVLQEAVDAGMFEGVRVLARSDEDHLKGRGKSVTNIVGWIDGVTFANNAVKGRLHLSESASQLRTMLADAWKRGKRDLVGLSLTGKAKGFKPVNRNGRRLSEVTGLAQIQTVDVVVDPSAGGTLNRLAAAEGKEETVGLKELIEALVARGNVKAIKAALAEASDEELAELKAEAKKDTDLAKAIAEAEALEDPKPKKAGEGDTDEPDGEPVAEADEDVVPKPMRKFVIREALEDTNLPDPVRKRITKRFAEASFTEDDLSEAIRDEVSAWADLEKAELVTRSVGTPRSSGTEVGIEEADRAKAALDGLFLGEAVEIDGEKIRPYRSIRQAYVELTGDGADGTITGRLPQKAIGRLGLSEANGGRVGIRLHEFDPDGELVLAEAISTSGWAEILGDSITRRVVKDYARSDLVSMFQPLVDIVPLSDVRTQRRVRYGGYANLATVTQGNPYGAMTSPTDEEATYSPAKRGGTETINLEAIINDDLGAIRQVPRRMARAAAQTLHEFVLDFLRSNPTIYDTVALFHATHNNLGSVALSAASLAAARLRMQKQAEMDNSKRLGLVPRHLWVPLDLEQTAYEITQSDRKPGTADNDANWAREISVTPHAIPYWTDTNNWFVSASTDDTPVVELGFYGSEEPEIFTQDMPNVGSMFTNDQLTYKIRHWYGGAVVDFRGLDGSVVA